MRRIKLSGRERTVIRGVGFGEGLLGPDLVERTGLPVDELIDMINGMLECGFLETTPYRDQITEEEFPSLTIEINPGYSQELREAIKIS